VFNGSRFRSEIAPRISDFVLSHNGAGKGANGAGRGKSHAAPSAVAAAPAMPDDQALKH